MCDSWGQSHSQQALRDALVACAYAVSLVGVRGKGLGVVERRRMRLNETAAPFGSQISAGMSSEVTAATITPIS
jgi:hypothetical protein